MLWIAPLDLDFRVEDHIEVEVAEDGTFSCCIEFEHSELYAITFKDEYTKGGWRPTNFMLEDRTIEFELYPMDDFDNNKIVGGKLNNHFSYLNKEISSQYNSKIDELIIQLRDCPYSEEFRDCIDSLSLDDLSQDDQTKLMHRINQLQAENQEYNKEGREIKQQLTDLVQKIEDTTLKSIKEKRSEASLATLYKLVISNKHQPNLETAAMHEEIFNQRFAKKYADNPMSTMITELLAAMKVTEGADFVDFEAPDLDGNMHKLSELIKDKVAVLDLWASWCGPCMRTSKSFIPIWEKYHDRGFEIVGVARENKDTQAMQDAIERLGLSWLNLVELNDRAKIWSKYGAGNGGGRVILIDKDGKIAAMDFTSDQLEEHLKELLP